MKYQGTLYLKKTAWQLTVALLIALSVNCQQQVWADSDANLGRRAHELAQNLLLIDTHVDTPYRLTKKMQDISGRSESGHTRVRGCKLVPAKAGNYSRARQGGLDAVFMAVYVPAKYEQAGARTFADKTIDLVKGFSQKWPDKFVTAYSVDEVRNQFGDSRISIIMGMENGAPIEGDLANLRHFYERGIRYITLCHSENNHICDSSFDRGPKWHGLSPFGKKVVAQMNRSGMIIDVSHVSDEAFYQIVQLSKAPVVATHSACRHFTPGWQRNMSDEMIQLLAEKGGVIQINFGSIFVNTRVNREFVKLRAEILRHIEAKNLQGEEREQYARQRWQQARLGKAHVSDVAANIDHVVKLVGIEHVGLGSDFDGVDNVPDGLDDVSCYPHLIYELLKLGYREEDIRKICAENFLRVWSEVEKTAVSDSPA
jgi:membrane dipeptidase